MKGLGHKKLIKLVGVASKERLALKITSIILAMATTLMGSGFLALSLYDKFGSFTVTIQKQDYDKVTKDEASLILSPLEDWTSNQTAQLTCEEIPNITNMEGKDIPDDIDLEQTNDNGEHHGDNYFAVTFYLKNNGDIPCTYEYKFRIINVVKNVDRAIRVRIYQNGIPETYARAKTPVKDQSKLDDEHQDTDIFLEAEPGTKKFQSNETVVRGTRANFRHDGPPDKYTVVIWIEGGDPDTQDDIIGGSIKFSMDFSIIEDDKGQDNKK